MIKIGINGFGRIGKLISRLVIADPRLHLTAINHPTMNKQDYLDILKYDSVHLLSENFDINMAKATHIHNHQNPEEIIWNDEIDVVLDTTGKFKSKETLIQHKTNTKLDDDTVILLTAPSSDETPMFVYGVNHVSYNNEDVISAASCTTTCLAPIVDILHKHYTINNGLVTTIHSATSSQYTVDKYTPGKRTGRGILNNIIPSSTGAASAIGKVIPELDGKLDAISVRVPVSNISLLDLSVNLEDGPCMNTILNLFRELSNNEYCEIIEVSDKLLVSQDFIGNGNNAIIDSPSCIKTGDMYKFLAWYDNEMGYAKNIIRLIKYIKF